MPMNCGHNEKDFKGRNRKTSCQSCCLGCCGIVLLFFLVCIAWYYRANEIAESTIFLKTENLKLIKTYDLLTIPNTPRTECYFEKVNRTTINPFSYLNAGTIVLKESDDLIAYVDDSRLCLVIYDPYKKFGYESKFSFYRILKNRMADNSIEVKTVFLGSIHTNLYGEWRRRGNRNKISISPDGKYIIMNAHAVDSRSHGEFRNKHVLLIWEIGDNVVEKDIVDRNGKKIPIIIKTEEELNNE